MQIEADKEVGLFVRDQVTGCLMFNSKAIEALGLSPTELSERGYPVDREASPGKFSRRMTRRLFRSAPLSPEPDHAQLGRTVGLGCG
jgi:hypothetical protein